MKKPTASSDSFCRAGEIVVVPFPYKDVLAEKRRPALVISNRKFNKTTGLVWVAMITSAENKAWPSDIPLPLEGSGLSALSRVRIAKVTTIDKSRIIRKIGKLDSETAMTVANRITAILA